jgi:hypothetical protein
VTIDFPAGLTVDNKGEISSVVSPGG